MYSFLLGREIREETLSPLYFFYGEESYLAHQFVDELKQALISPDLQNYNLERFHLEDTSWMEIIDLAKTIPFFFSSWRIIVVEISEGEKDTLTPQEERIIRDYFPSLSQRTVLVVILSGKIKRGHPLLRFFSTLPSSQVFLKGLKTLKEKALYDWMEKKFASLGKRATDEAKKRLEEIIGSDLWRLDNELEKLTTFVAEKNVIDIDDVNQVSGWIKTFIEWELANSLEKANFEECLVVLNNLFKEGNKAEYILGIISNFFRDILLAKVWLREKTKDRKEIFKELKPHISEKFTTLYSAKWRAFFSLVETISQKELNSILGELEQIDLKIKTSDVSPQILLESFLYNYCDFRKKSHKKEEFT